MALLSLKIDRAMKFVIFENRRKKVESLDGKEFILSMMS